MSRQVSFILLVVVIALSIAPGVASFGAGERYDPSPPSATCTASPLLLLSCFFESNFFQVTYLLTPTSRTKHIDTAILRISSQSYSRHQLEVSYREVPNFLPWMSSGRTLATVRTNIELQLIIGLRDYSQAVDVGALKRTNLQTILNVVIVLGFLAHGYATHEFEVTKERLGCYLPTEHIDNPKGYAEGEDARQYDPRLRGPVNPRELEIDPR